MKYYLQTKYWFLQEEIWKILAETTRHFLIAQNMLDK